MTALPKDPAAGKSWRCPHCDAPQVAAGGACSTAPTGASACGSGCGAGGSCTLLTCTACGQSYPDPKKSWLTYRLSLWLGRRSGSRGPAAKP